jgi:hypothetical protein
VPAQTKDRRTISIEFTIAILRSEGKIEGLAAILRDVTKRFEEMRRLRQAAQRADPNQNAKLDRSQQKV